ncbi:hypothetical protein ARMSODRAFT_468888 [Armillaria solidipes]|uniref:Uncharacterized protein n=1 Tax=Armillaria solidipes TaxID=1076256 RepID=A0A2H3BJ36_9AGAR|nr:hypothetical protein ARMSODRAFT_468888 [Armillaria solidipes]
MVTWAWRKKHHVPTHTFPKVLAVFPPDNPPIVPTPQCVMEAIIATKCTIVFCLSHFYELKELFDDRLIWRTTAKRSRQRMKRLTTSSYRTSWHQRKATSMRLQNGFGALYIAFFGTDAQTSDMQALHIPPHILSPRADSQRRMLTLPRIPVFRMLCLAFCPVHVMLLRTRILCLTGSS